MYLFVMLCLASVSQGIFLPLPPPRFLPAATVERDSSSLLRASSTSFRSPSWDSST